MRDVEIEKKKSKKKGKKKESQRQAKGLVLLAWRLHWSFDMIRGLKSRGK